jgi:hypothetical protein
MNSAADYYGAAAVPPTTAYGPPKLDFSALSGALDTFVKGRQEGREEDTARAFRNGIPMVKALLDRLRTDGMPATEATQS